MRTNKNDLDRLPIVVLRSNDNCFLDVLRCCGEEKIPVISVIYNWERSTPWLSEKSIYFENPIEIASPADNEQLAACQLIEIGKSLFSEYKRKVLVIPSSDTTLLFLQRNFNDFKPYFIQMGHQNFEKPFLDVFSKYEFSKILGQNKISIPVTLPCFKVSDVEKCVSNIQYPCIYKPVTKDLTNSFPSNHNGLKAIINYNAEELRKNLLKELSSGYQLIVQEYIDIRDNTDEITAYIYIGKNLNPIWTSAQVTLKRHPEIFGTGYLGKNINSDEISQMSIKVAKALNWRGFMSVEFKFDTKDSVWKVIEANFRPWLSIYFQAAIGHNYIKDLYNDAYGFSVFCKNEFNFKLKEEFYKINIAVLIEKLIKESSNKIDFKNKFAKWFDEHPGKYVFSTFHKLDREPALFELKMLHSKYPKYIDIISDKLDYYLGLNNK